VFSTSFLSGQAAERQSENLAPTLIQESFTLYFARYEISGNYRKKEKNKETSPAYVVNMFSGDESAPVHSCSSLKQTPQSKGSSGFLHEVCGVV